MTQLTLQPVTKSNWIACATLVLPKKQSEFVAPNVFSIAESKFEPHYQPRAIMLGETAIGFLMYCNDDASQICGEFCLFRLMIVDAYQGKGLGYEAVGLALSEIKAAGGQMVSTMYKPDNEIAGRLYTKLGFRPVGVLDDGDIELHLDLV